MHVLFNHLHRTSVFLIWSYLVSMTSTLGLPVFSDLALVLALMVRLLLQMANVGLEHSSNVQMVINFHLWMHGDVGTNTKGELLALWLVLFFSSRANIILEQIVGNSLAIVDWANSKATINSIAMSSWLSHTKTLLDNCPQTSILHSFREHNAVADSLSWRGLDAVEGGIFYEIMEGS